MNQHTARRARSGPVGQGTPPAGTAIIRPLAHVRAVRERSLQELAPRPADAESPSARAWAWALGETSIAPVTGRVTAAPPSRADIKAEITEADQRRLRGNRENRADGAAAILRWLIGDDDYIPVTGSDPGELIGSFGDVVRSPAQIARQALAGVRQRDASGDPAGQDYRDGVTATLNWVLNPAAGAPITARKLPALTTRDLKTERLHATDLIGQRQQNPASDGPPLPDSYGSGVRSAIDWLLGDTTTLYSSGHAPGSLRE